MPLSPGTRVGPYEVLSSLGAGGMGEVYRARDTKLGREIALKILPESFVTDADRLARFEREARTLASLNHPNIAQIYGMEERALAMELVAGDDLSALIARGPIPVPEALAIARQIADALEAAHDQGVVHRDLKPANVKVRTDGTVKVLDFGLAKALLPDDASQPSSKSNSPTLTAQGTQLGTILGTAAYMAPEQARGKAVDRRADVWAFGVVVFEMLTGRRMFEGEEVSDVLAAVLRQDVDLNALPAATPASVRRLLRRCLERDPRKRLSAIGDARLDIDEGDGAPTVLNMPAPKIEVARRIPAGLVIGAGVLLAAAAFFAGRYWPGQSGSTAPASQTLMLSQVTDDAGIEGEPSLSPDGTSIAFVKRMGTNADIFVQRVGGRTTIPIAVDPAIEEGSPSFSPNGEMIAFHTRGQNERGGIFIVGATGESARRLSDFGFHPAWSPDGQRLVFCTEGITFALSRTSTSELWTVDLKGGAPVKLFAGDAVQPAWSPKNKRIAYWMAGTGGQRDIITMPAGGGEPVPLTNDSAVDWGPQWSGDGRYLYFASDRGGAMNIWRVAIDESSGKPLAPPEPVTQGAGNSDQVTLSQDGARIAFRSANASSNPAVMSLDEAAERLGAAKHLLDRTGFLVPTSASPDGQWIAHWNLGDRHEDIFVSRPDATGLRRLTEDQFRDRFGAWSPDSRELGFYSNRSGVYNIFAIRPDGSGRRAITEETGDNENNLLYPVFSPTGDRLIASRIRRAESLLMDPRRSWSSQTPEKLATSVGEEGWVVPNQWSPDGKRLAGPILNATGVATGVGVFDMATRKARILTRDRVNFVGMAWLSDSRRVLYQLDDDIVLIDVDSGRRKVMPAGVHLGFGLVISHDRRSLYVSVRREQADVWLGERPK